MKKNFLLRAVYKQLVVCVGTDIPPIPHPEFFLYAGITEKLKLNADHVFTMNEIFEGYNYTNSQRFTMLSYLIRKGVLRKERSGEKRFKLKSIPKIFYKDCKEMRIYENAPHVKTELLKRVIK